MNSVFAIVIAATTRAASWIPCPRENVPSIVSRRRPMTSRFLNTSAGTPDSATTALASCSTAATEEPGSSRSPYWSAPSSFHSSW